MPRYGVVLFDLDGTLTDPGDGITRSVRYALESLGVEIPDRRRLEAFVGPPLLESFQRLCDLDEPRARAAVGAYREYFAERGLYENEVYAGIPEILAELAAKACLVLVATSKPAELAERILRGFGLRPYFRDVVGPRLDDLHASKDDIVRAALSRVSNWRQREAVMVGDREHDVRGAQANAIDSIAVGYGYGSMEELQNARPTFHVGSVEELADLLRGLT
jgi:phosphoglycolate phosphatase